MIFTASMAEYADPVIDWLDQNRTLFDKRYFRQACYFKNGSYLKDLTVIEPDLSSVCLLDNSPISYSLNKGKQKVQGIYLSKKEVFSHIIQKVHN